MDHHYFPMKEEELNRAGLHFWFLGHTHVRIPARDEFTGTTFAYCGTPEPDGFGCQHSGSAWIIELDEAGHVRGKAIATGSYRFQDLEKTVTGVEEIEELIRQMSMAREQTLTRLKLRGILPRETFESRHDWREALEKKLFYLEWDDTGLQIEINRNTIPTLFPEGSFPYLLLKRLAETDEPGALQQAYALLKEVGE